MKKLVLMALLLSLCLSACGDEGETSQAPVLNNSQSSISSQSPQEDPFKEVNSLLDKGETEKAYNLLLGMEKTEDVLSMLDRFSVEPSNIKITYNDGSVDSLEFIYNSFGERLKETLNGKIKVYNTFDTTGTLLSSAKAQPDGTTFNSAYSYDASGNLVSIKESIGTEVNCTVNYSYENGKLKGETYNYANGLKIECAFTYDDKGREISETTVYSNGKTESIEYSYNGEGKLISEVFTDSEGKEEKVEYTYDGNGDLALEVHGGNEIQGTKSDEWEIRTIQYTYSQRSLIKIVCTIENQDGTFVDYSTQYTYNEQGLLISETREGSDYSLDVQYSYDEKGNLSKRVRKNISPAGETETDIYEYSGYIYYFG